MKQNLFSTARLHLAPILSVLCLGSSLHAAIVHQYNASVDTGTPSVLEDQVGSMDFSAVNVARGTTTSANTVFTHSYSLSSFGTNDGANASPFFNPLASSFSFEVWVKLGSLDATPQVIFETGAQGAGTGIFVNQDGFRLLNGVSNAVEYDLSIDFTGLDTSDFIQLTGTFDIANNDVSFFVKGAGGGDSSLTDTVGTIGSGNNNAGFLSPGSNGIATDAVGNVGGVGNPNIFPSVSKFEGEIALLNVYDTALTSSEVQTAFDNQIIPEPSTGLALLTGAGLMLVFRRRRN